MKKGDVIYSKFVLYSFLFLSALPFMVMTAFASVESSVSEVQRLLNLTNSSLLRGDLDGSIESLDQSLTILQELKEAEEEEITDNNNNDGSNGLEDEGGNYDNGNDKGVDGGGIVDDNVERSQECVENAEPGEVCAL
jgi:hypothetical protein